MADRYWVGGTGIWNGTNTANWSTTSGGTGGASVPTSLDRVFVNSSSGGSGAQIRIAAGYSAVCFSFSRVWDMNVTAVSQYSGTLTIGDAGGGTGSGDFTNAAGYFIDIASVTVLGSLSGTPSTLSVTNSGISQVVPLYIAAGSMVAGPSCNVGTSVTVQSGATLDLSSQNFTCRSITVHNGATLLSSSATLTCSGSSFFIYDGATFNPNTLSALSISGGSFYDGRNTPGTYQSLTLSTGSGNYATYNTPNATMTITSLVLKQNGMLVWGGQTVIIGTIDTSLVNVGSAVLGKNPSSTLPFTLSSTTGTRQLNGLIISDCIATGGATFTANATSIDAGNNTGIQFANSRGLLAFFT